MTLATLEQTLREHPGDRASWLAYADRLLERGDARGSLIKLEQRRARTGPTARDTVEEEIAALVREHQQTWDAELPPGVTVLARRHGFATKVGVDWSESAPVVIDQALRGPFVTALRIAPDAGSDDDWHEDPDGASYLTEPSESVDVGALATLDLGRLDELDLSYLRIGTLGAKALAVSTFFRGEASGVRALASAPGRMQVLDLRYTGVGDAGLAALVTSPCFGGVRRLHLQRNALTAEGVRSLRSLAGLAELDLRYNDIGAEGVRALLDAPFVGSLRRLLLNPPDVGDDGAKTLASAPQLPPALRTYWRSV
jgi:uncharacterized protein (TIGR02996 family)